MSHSSRDHSILKGCSMNHRRRYQEFLWLDRPSPTRGSAREALSWKTTICILLKTRPGGIVEYGKKKRTFIASDVGVPQGGIVSPLLSNLVLHELDLYIQDLIKEKDELSIGEPRAVRNPQYYQLSSRIKRLKEKRDREGLRTAVRLRRRTPSTIPNPRCTSLRYVRYADDWLVGVWGTKSLALELKSNIGNFLQSLKLTLSSEKTLITNTRLEKVKFLGTYIKRVAPVKGPLMKPRAAGNIWMTAPLDIITKRLKEKKFWRPGPKGPIPLGISRFTCLPLKDLILRFRTILSGILNYYSFADNLYTLRYIYFLLRSCLQRTIQKKLDIGPRDFLLSYGPSVKLTIIKRDGSSVLLDFKCPTLKRNPMNFLGTENSKDPMLMKDWKIHSITALGQCCANCGSTKKVEMHHLKHIKGMNAKLDAFGKMMSKINRKQVPLCRPCHLSVHKGTCIGFSLRYFKYIKWDGEPKWS